MTNSASTESSILGPIFGPLVAAAPLNELAAGPPDLAAAEIIRTLSLPEAFAPHRIADPTMADACLAGLWLMYDHLDESHTISQSIDTPSGSYWHAIMHRREADFDNAKYWFRRVGTHPIFATLADAARELAREHFAGAQPPDRGARFLAESTDWDPFQFVDLCAAAARKNPTAALLCQLVQQRECQLLFEYCHQRAVR